MRWVMAVIATASIAGAIWWGTHRDSAAPEISDLADLEGDASSAAPMAEGGGPALATQGASTRPRTGIKGRAAIVGTVRQKGRPVAAVVEVRLLFEINPALPNARRGMRWFETMLVDPTSSTEALATATAGEDGRFLVEGLPSGAYDVSARTKAAARGSATATVAADGARVDVNVVVFGGSESLRGRVVHKDGRPWQGQVVVDRATPNRNFEMGGVRGQALTVDAEGRFVASDLEAGTVTVTAIVGGSFRAGSTPVSVPYAGEYVLTVDGSTVLGRGKIVSDADGSPISGASVLCGSGGSSGDLSMLVARTTSDAEGRFEVPVLATVGGSLYVIATGFAPSSKNTGIPKEGQTFDFRLVRGAMVVGRAIRAADGQPVPGLQVYAMALGDREGNFPADPVTTDGAGHFEIVDLAPGEAMVYGQGAGYFTEGQKDASAWGYNALAFNLVSGQTSTVELRMLAGVRMPGKVVDSNGTPVPGAVVAPSAGGRPTRGITAPPSATVSAADGSFVVESLLPGVPVTFTADAPGFATARAGPVTPSETDAAPLELRFAVDRRVDVLVLDDAAGTPVVGARVTGWSNSPTGGVQVPPAWTGADGKAKLGPIPPGDSSIQVEAEGYARTSNTRVAEGDTMLTVRVAKGLDLVGRVLMPDQSPAAGVTVSFQAMDGRMPWMPPEATGVDGSFRFRGLGAGSVTLTATLNREGKTWTATLAAQAGAKDLQIVLAAPDGKSGSYTLTVRVVDAAGTPVSRGQIRFSTPNSSNGSNLVDGKATFQVGSNRENMTVEVWGARGSDGLLLPLGPAKVSVADGVTEVEVRMGAESSIDGVVKTKDGVGVKGAYVQAFPATGKDGSRRYNPYGAASSARTDAEGRFRLGGLATDDYTLSVQPAVEFSPLSGVAAKGGTSGVELVVRSGSSVTITVLDPDGNPVAGANVSAQVQNDMGNRWRSGGGQQTDTKGQVRLVGLDVNAIYQFDVNLRRDDVMGVSRSDWKPVDETIRLTRVHTIRGVVKDLGGRPVANAMVQYRAASAAEGEGWNGTGTQEDGTFQLGGLAAGQFILRAFVDGEAQDKARETTVVAGTRDVVLTADVGLELSVRVENWPSDGTRWGSATLISTQEGNTRSVGQGISPTGVAKFRGLKTGVDYTLWIPPGPEGMSYLRAGVRPGPEIAVRLAPGKAISGRIVVPEGAIDVNITAQQDSMGLGNSLPIGADGRYELKGLPDGRWKVMVWGRAKDGSRSFQANGEAMAGGTLDLEMKEQK